LATSDNQLPADAGRAKKRRWSGWGVLATLVMVVIVVALALKIPVGTRTECTCAVCRAGRIDTTWFGRLTSVVVETPCSEWYRENVEANHDHVWIPRGGSSKLNVIGRAIGATSRPENPIWQITPEEQVEIYIHSADKLAMKRVFAEMDDWTPGTVGGERTEMIVDTLKRWKDNGFSGSWAQWIPLPKEVRSQSDKR
jgi:hypothetical protein